MKMNLMMPLNLDAPEVEQLVLANEDVLKYLDGKSPKKVIFVKGKIVNLVI
jgi:leucyl-tRNA synthetase